MRSIVLVVLGVLIFALRGVFGTFPDSWEWVGIILAGVGVVVGVPSIFQMALGRPKLMAQFDRIEHETQRRLAVFFKNAQLGSPTLNKRSIWRTLGVKRDTIESFTVSFRIFEVGTGKCIIPVKQARIYSDNLSDAGTWRTTLPPTLSWETSVMIALWDKKRAKAIILPDRTKPIDELGEGLYQIQLIVAVDGEPRLYSRQFIVGKTADDLNWVKSVSDKGGSQP